MSFIAALIYLQVAGVPEWPYERASAGLNHTLVILVSFVLAVLFLWRKPIFEASVFSPPRYAFVERAGCTLHFSDRRDPTIRIKMTWLARKQIFVTPMALSRLSGIAVVKSPKEDLIRLIPPDHMAALVALSIEATFKKEETT